MSILEKLMKRKKDSSGYYVQRGWNEKYPAKIITWKLGQPVPEWLSDLAKIAAIDANTNRVYLQTRDNNQGGYELLTSSGNSKLVTTKSRSDVICKDISRKIGGIFSLTPIQFRLLYEEAAQ